MRQGELGIDSLVINHLRNHLYVKTENKYNTAACLFAIPAPWVNRAVPPDIAELVALRGGKRRCVAYGVGSPGKAIAIPVGQELGSSWGSWQGREPLRGADLSDGEGGRLFLLMGREEGRLFSPGLASCVHLLPWLSPSHLRFLQPLSVGVSFDVVGVF